MAASAASSITIVPLQPHDTTEFIKFPWRVYAGDHLWVPPLILDRKAFLNPRKNPFFQHAQMQLFLARQGDQTVGRIAAVINTAHDQYHHEHAGFFGLFECLPEAETAAIALLDAAAAWVRERSATFLRGPVNLSMNELDVGILIEGFGASAVFQSAYNPPYYATFIEAAGLTKCKDLLAFYRHYYPLPSSRVQEAIARRQARRNVTVRHANMRDFTADVKRIVDIFNDAWSDNWGFVPVTEAEAQHMAKELKLAVVPELTFIAELDGEPVGCFLALPDLNQGFRHMNGHLTPWGLLRFFLTRRRIDTIRIALTGVKKRYRRLGIDLLLYSELWKQAAKRGILHGEAAWLLEDNTMIIRAMEALGAMPYKRYRLYQKSLV